MSIDLHGLQVHLENLLRQGQSGLHDALEKQLVASRCMFELDGKVAGTLAPDLAVFLAQTIPGLNLEDDCLSLSPVCSKDSVPVLEHIANALREAGHLPRWRNELLAVLADDASQLGVIERAAMRPLGLRTQATHLVAVRNDGRFWLQQRAFNKDTDPGLWDTLAGGLVGTVVQDGRRVNESLRLATCREAWEEAGVDADLLSQMQVLPRSQINRMVSEGHMVQTNYSFIATLPSDFQPRNLDGEVETFAHFDAQQVTDMIYQGQLALEPAIIMLQTIKSSLS
jgi:isopentenyldiphosphate isomerase